MAIFNGYVKLAEGIFYMSPDPPTSTWMKLLRFQKGEPFLDFGDDATRRQHMMGKGQNFITHLPFQ